MKIKGVRIWPWHRFNYRFTAVKWGCTCNRQDGLSVTLNGYLFYTSKGR